ncbi:chromate transporter [Pseudomonas sp. R2.Fl]|nr:chromate transporter [Pseudomonas sp. R2.Fl]
MMSQSEPLRSPERPSLSTLFLLCFKIGILSFGGGLSGWIYQEFVLRNQLLSDDDFASSMAIAQMLPGANVVNLVICIGEQLRGPLGAAACFVGFLIGPFFAVVALYQVFDSLAEVELLPVAFNGIAFAALGLLLLTCIEGTRRALRFPPSIVVVAVTAFLVGILEWPLIPVALAMAPVSILLVWRKR